MSSIGVLALALMPRKNTKDSHQSEIKLKQQKSKDQKYMCCGRQIIQLHNILRRGLKGGPKKGFYHLAKDMNLEKKERHWRRDLGRREKEAGGRGKGGEEREKSMED